MKNILTIIKKELDRFFKDARLVLTTLILPGLMIFALYSLMGDAMSGLFEGEPGYVPIAKTVNLPDSISALVVNREIDIEFISIDEDDAAAAKTEIETKEVDLLMVFPLEFDDLVLAAQTLGDPAPTIEMFYNSTKPDSVQIFTTMNALIDAYETSISNVIALNADPDGSYDLASEKDMIGQVFSMMLPFLILSFLFSGCLAVTPESIAGEKERGTIATLLVTPIKRRELAIGKIIALSLLASLAALSSFVGTILSLPKIIGLQGPAAGAALGNFIFTDYIGIIFIIMAIVLLIVAFLAVLSAYARSVKEASALAMPFMIVTLLVGMLTMFDSGATGNLFLYMIPIYGPVQALVGIFSFAADWSHILISGLTSMAYAAVFAFVLVRMFQSERIMFKR